MVGTINLKHGGVWKEPQAVKVRDAGVWKDINTGWVRENGVWKQVWPTPPPEPETISYTGNLTDPNGKGITELQLARINSGAAMPPYLGGSATVPAGAYLQIYFDEGTPGETGLAFYGGVWFSLSRNSDNGVYDTNFHFNYPFIDASSSIVLRNNTKGANAWSWTPANHIGSSGSGQGAHYFAPRNVASPVQTWPIAMDPNDSVTLSVTGIW